MNKRFFSAVIVFCAVFAADAGAFTEKRSQWWKIRAENISKERNEIAKAPHASADILQLLDRDIARSSQMASLFSGETDAPQSGTAPSDGTHLRSAAETIVPVVYASYALRYLADSIPDKERTAEIMPLLCSEVRPIFSAQGLEADDLFLNDWIRKNTTENERIFITSECITAAAAASRDKAVSSAVSAAADNAAIRLSSKTNISAADERKAVTDAACTFFNGYSFKKETAFTGAMIIKSSLWKRIEFSAGKDALRLAAARDIIGRSSAENDARKLNALCANETGFETAAFRRLSTQFCDVRRFPASNDPSVKIPAEPDMPALFNEIDAVRKSILLDNRSALPEDAMRRADARIQQIIAKTMKAPADTFFRQEEKARILAGDDTPDTVPAPAADPAFTSARGIFRAQVNAANGYRKATVQYIGFALADNSRDGASPLTAYTSRCSAQKDLLNAILALSRKAAECAPLPESTATQIYKGLHQKERLLYDYCISQSQLNAEDRKQMDKHQLAEALKIRENLSDEYYAVLKETSAVHTAFASGTGTFAAKAKLKAKLDDKALAQQEVTLLADSIKDYTDAYHAMNYSREALESYELFFNRLYREADSGQVSDELIRATKNNTLIPMVHGFNADTLKQQNIQRTYIKKAVLRDTARLKTLVDFYKRQKTEIREFPTDKELRAIELGFTANPSVQISQWKMTDTNFTEIDRNAAKILSNIRKRNAWKSGTSGNAGADRLEQIPQTGMTLSIPDGFEIKEISSSDTSVVKQFSSQDNLSSIYVAIVPLLGKSDREAAEEWLIKAGKKTVKSSACRAGGSDYYWNLAKDEHRNVSETYALVQGESLVIISGETSKERYPFFKEKMNAVFKSISR